jgi:hypothetical protein
MTSKVPKINANTNLVQYFLNIESPRFEDWCFSYSEKYPLTKSLLSKAQSAWNEATNIRECQRQERANRRKSNEIEKAKAELAAALEEVKASLPKMLEQIRERIEHELELATKPFQWDEIDHPLVNGTWELHHNEYSCWKELVTESYDESPDGMRSGGLYSTWKTVERGAGSYWTNSLTGSKEFFVSRAKKDEPAPEVIYPHCTIDDRREILWYKEQALQKRQRAQEWVEEASSALADVNSNIKWILTTVNYPLYLRICRAVRTIDQLKTQNEISSAVREVLANLLMQ